MSHNAIPTEVGLEARPVTRPWNRPDQTAPMPALAPTEAEVVLKRGRRRRRRDDTQRIWHLAHGTPRVDPPRDALPAPAALEPAPAFEPAALAPVAPAPPSPAPRAPAPRAAKPPSPELRPQAVPIPTPPPAWPFVTAPGSHGPFEDLSQAYDRPIRRWGRRFLSLFRLRRR